MGTSDLPACLLSSTKPSKISRELTCFSSSSAAACMLISPCSELQTTADDDLVPVSKHSLLSMFSHIYCQVCSTHHLVIPLKYLVY